MQKIAKISPWISCSGVFIAALAHAGISPASAPGREVFETIGWRQLHNPGRRLHGRNLEPAKIKPISTSGSLLKSVSFAYLHYFALLPDLSKASAGSFQEVKGSSKKHLMASQNMTRRDSRGLKNLGIGKLCGAPFTASGKARNKALLSLQADFQKQDQGPIFVRLAWKCFKHERVWLVSCNGHQVSCRKPLASSKWQKKTFYGPNTTSGTPQISQI